MAFIFGILGFLGGILCAIGDVLFDYKSKLNEKLGRDKLIERDWADMAKWRFKLSIGLATIGVPLFALGLMSLAMQLAENNSLFATIFWLISLVGITGGTFIHIMLCCFPIIYKTMLAKGCTFDQIEATLSDLYHAVKIPFFSLYFCLVIVPSIAVSYAIVVNYLALPNWTISLMPVSLMVIGGLLRVVKQDWFANFPGIIMPSLGMGLLGLLAAIHAL
ncbi:hypothetical protein SAMN04488134_107134 [Amphibacillus marinus]|uniref:Uncharacterized protein n=1 Tax=Amphibacillus marinus TaxID=872970 RepID=A0A1H8PP31_9BACI|nr:DUF6796 family protein [Amphibacillus marinus]SEO43546.1 hypothetical protein SAMN04488134_107134 [Amphibacillus marinus]